MSAGFPPQPVYPLAIDSDRTLFLVFNSSEAKLAADNSAWADEIEIEPVGDNDLEQWAENGFANIDGELFYYDSVEKNAAGKIFKFKRCIRNITGSGTKFNPTIGDTGPTWVRGFVIAEHHNQLVDSVIATERYILELSDALDLLSEEPPCIDDAFCPEINFRFEIDEEASNACEGVVGEFDVTINGNFTTFRIDFGDGESSTTERSGTHIYPPNSTIDPVVTVTNDRCVIVQTPIERLEPQEPNSPDPQERFEIPIPAPPDFPNITLPDVDVPIPEIEFPQIVFPCLDIGPSGPVVIPSVIIVDPPINIPSVIVFGPVNVPTTITFGTAPSFSPIGFGPAPAFTPIGFGPAPGFAPIGFGPGPTFSPIDFGPGPTFSPIDFGPGPTFSPIDFGPGPTFSPIEFGPGPTFSPIEFGPGPTFSPIEFGPGPTFSPIDFGPAPSVPVVWGPVPTVSCTVTVECAGGGGAFRAQNQYSDDFVDGFEPIELSADLGIPSKIEIIAPKFPDVKLVHNLPVKIDLEVPQIPNIQVEVPQNFPRKIAIVSEAVIPERIRLEVEAGSIPESIKLDASGIPESIRLELLDVPSVITVVGFPEFIPVKGIPDSIEVKMPSEIVARLEMPKDMEIPLVYKGGPVPIQFDASNLFGDSDHPCFALVPCDPKK